MSADQAPARRPSPRRPKSTPAPAPPPALPLIDPAPADAERLVRLALRDGISGTDRLVLYAILVELRGIRVALSNLEARP